MEWYKNGQTSQKQTAWFTDHSVTYSRVTEQGMGVSGTHIILLQSAGNKFAPTVVLGGGRSKNLMFQLTLLLTEAFSAAEIFSKPLQEWQNYMYGINKSTGYDFFFLFDTINIIL